MDFIWNDKRSIVLSRVLVCFFAAALIVLDAGCAALLFGGFSYGIMLTRENILCLSLCVFACSIPGFLLLFCMNRLLANLLRSRVFTGENVRLLRIVSYCCFAAGLVCLAGAFWLPSLAAITAAAGFVGLIVRIVKNVFQQAIAMKDELDFTI